MAVLDTGWGLFPEKPDPVWNTVGLKDQILSSKELWLCYGCGKCSETCPREAESGDYVSALRRFAIAHFEPTGLTRLMFRNPVAFNLITLAIAMVLFFFLRTMEPEQRVSIVKWIILLNYN
jgi:Fe-S oxidoreductase